MVAFGDDGRFAKGPAQVGVAQLGATKAFDLACAGDGAFDQATVREEVFDRREAAYVADLIEDVAKLFSLDRADEAVVEFVEPLDATR